jgi:hypothetical protein
MKTIRVVGMVLLCLALLLAPMNCGTSEESPQSDTTPPSSPANLTKTTPDNENTPTFTWNSATDADSGIDRYLMSVDGGVAEVAGGAGTVAGLWVNVGNITSCTLDYALSDGSHTFGVRAVDKAGNVGAAASLSFNCDTTPPTISNVSEPVTSHDSAMISWTTDEKSTSKVDFWDAASHGLMSAVGFSLTTTHSVNLTGLTSNTSYQYRVKSTDECGNEAVSADYSFVTLPS